MKKLIALISAIAVMGTMSMTAFAGIEATPNKLETGAALEENAEGGYKASFTSADVNTQTTILAVNGTAINTNSIMYINQLAQDSETTINFDLKEAPKVGETVYVYMGGDKLAKKTVGTITNVADATKAKIKGTITGFYPDTAVLPNLTITDAEGNENAVTVNADGSFEFEAAAGTYELVATKPYHCGYTMSDIVVSASDVVINPTVYAGDLDESTWVDLDDYGPILDNYDLDDTADNWDEISVYDTDESGWIDLDDYGMILDNYDAEEFIGTWE